MQDPGSRKDLDWSLGISLSFCFFFLRIAFVRLALFAAMDA